MTKKEKVLGPKAVVVTTQEDFEAELKSESVVYNSLALGIIPRADGTFSIVKIPVDTKGLKTGELEVIDTASNKWEANEKFKIAAIRSGVL